MKKLKLKYKLKFPTSTYCAYETKDRLYVGGSLWNRRKVLYSRRLTMSAKGIVRIFKKVKGKFKKEKEVKFPNMVYPILELPNKTLFIGLKSKNKTFNLLDLNGKILKQKDDKIGGGVYGIDYNKKRNKIVLATRKGMLEFIDAT
jgi:hypothetical protein